MLTKEELEKRLQDLTRPDATPLHDPNQVDLRKLPRAIAAVIDENNALIEAALEELRRDR